MNKDTPLVSVIIVTYKPNLDYISQAIDSVKKQTYKNIEIIIVNDKSTDEIEVYFSELKNKNKNIIYFCNETKKGVATARNQGIFFSKGKYITILDDDDFWNDEKKIEKQVEYLEQHNDYGFVGVDKILVYDKGHVELIKMKKTYIDIKDSLLQSNQFAHSSIMIRKEAMYKCGIYGISCFAEDYDLWCRIGIYYKFCNIDSSISYRIVKSSLSHEYSYKTRVEAFKVFWKYKKHYPNFFKALILRIGDMVLPQKVTMFLLNVISGK